MKKFATVLFCSLFLSGQAQALNPWTDCGLGAMVFADVEGETGKMLAAISNITWDLGSTAVTSATSSKDTCAGAKTDAASFLLQNLDQVEAQIAMGTGNQLGSVLDIYSCSQEAQANIIKDIRLGVAKPITNQNYLKMNKVKKAEMYWNVIDDLVHNKHAKTCSS